MKQIENAFVGAHEEKNVKEAGIEVDSKFSAKFDAYKIYK